MLAFAPERRCVLDDVLRSPWLAGRAEKALGGAAPLGGGGGAYEEEPRYRSVCPHAAAFGTAPSFDPSGMYGDEPERPVYRAMGNLVAADAGEPLGPPPMLSAARLRRGCARRRRLRHARRLRRARRRRRRRVCARELINVQNRRY